MASIHGIHKGKRVLIVAIALVAIAPAAHAQPSSSLSTTNSSDYARGVDGPGTLIQPTGAVPPNYANACCDLASSRVEQGFLDTISQSLFGKPDPNTWRPLTLSTFFSEGWNESWVPSPNGSGGAPRQGWINAMDGNMYRLGFFTYAEGFNEAARNDAYLGSYTLYTPLSRRFELITNIPFVVVNNISNGLPTLNPPGGKVPSSQSQTTFGDISFTPRVLLHETQDFTLTAETTVLVPTGNSPLEGKTALIPAVGFWNNPAGGWAIRGGLACDIPLQGSAGDTLISQFAFGQTITDHDRPLLGDFTYYLSTVVSTPLSNGSQTSVTLTPGIRTHLGNDWYFLAGLPIPVTRARTADVGAIFWFMKAW
jgi:hypothetical protein